MTTLQRTFIACVFCLCISAAALAGESVQIKLKDGSTWRGQVADDIDIRFVQSGVEVSMAGRLTKASDSYVIVDGTLAGVKKQCTIFRTDIVSIKSGSTTESSASPKPAQTTVPVSTPLTTDSKSTTDTTKTTVAATDDKSPTPAKSPDGKPQGVFLLPMTGEVGQEFRHDEIEAVAKEADKWGPGQIIVLKIDSGGGLGIEMEKIHYTMMEVKKRHRVVAWITEAISAAAATAIHCDEIYFQTTGVLGAMTGFAGTHSLQGEELQKWLRKAGEWMEAGGHSKYLAYAMIDDVAVVTYDKDPVTGKVTWYNDFTGKTVMSDERTNLVFTSTTAMDSKFADGIADTEEDLAKLLNLPKWVELSDYGRKIHTDWVKTCDLANKEIPMIAQRLNYEGMGSGDQIVVMGKQIENFKKLIAWWDRCPNVCFLKGVPPKEDLERQVGIMQHDLAEIKKSQQSRKR